MGARSAQNRSTLRLTTQGHCPKVSTGPKIDQQVTSLGYQPIVPMTMKQILEQRIAPKLGPRLVSLATLIRMKEEANRPQDRAEMSSFVPGRATMPTDDLQTVGIDWSLTSREGARREQMRRWGRMPLADMIRALEEMQVLAERLVQSSGPGST
jgi:hypothetical protein